MKAFVIIDVQNNLVNRKIFNKELFLTTVNDAIARCEDRSIPIICIQHNSNFLKPNTEEWEVSNTLKFQKQYTCIQKMHGNAFRETELDKYLKSKAINEIILCGLVSHGCVKASCLGGKELGYYVHLLRNGHTCWNKDAQERILTTEAELLEKQVSIIDLTEFE